MNIKKYSRKHDFSKKQKYLFGFGQDLHIVKCPSNDPQFAYYYCSHYPDSDGIVGRQFTYKVFFEKELAGIIGANSAGYQPGGYKKFNEYFDISPTPETYKLFLNNNVYRLIKSAENRGTKTLRLFRERIFRDYYEKYGQFLVGLVTFVEPPRDGTVYKADNWDHLGMTKGVSITRPNNVKAYAEGQKKHIYAMKFSERYKNRILNELESKKGKKKRKNKNIIDYFGRK